MIDATGTLRPDDPDLTETLKVLDGLDVGVWGLTAGTGDSRFAATIRGWCGRDHTVIEDTPRDALSALMRVMVVSASCGDAWTSGGA